VIGSYVSMTHFDTFSIQTHSLTISQPFPWADIQPWRTLGSSNIRLTRTTDKFGPRCCVAVTRCFFGRERSHCEIGLSKGRVWMHSVRFIHSYPFRYWDFVAPYFVINFYTFCPRGVACPSLPRKFAFVHSILPTAHPLLSPDNRYDNYDCRHSNSYARRFPTSVFMPPQCRLLCKTHQPHQYQLVKISRQTNTHTVPAENNSNFDSKVLSRQHAEVWKENTKVRCCYTFYKVVCIHVCAQIFIRDVKTSKVTFIEACCRACRTGDGA